MKIVFVHQSDKEFCGDTLKTSPLGGTETALIGVSRALAQNPENQVFVFTKTAALAIYDGVTYLPLSALAVWANQNDIDVLLSIRQWLPLALPVRAKMRVYFSPDAYNQPALQRAFDIGITFQEEHVVLPFLPTRLFFENADAIFCVGKWQAQSLVERLQYPVAKIFVTANGVFLENFSPKELAHRETGIVYSSTPFRGLNHLITMIPQIRKLVPELKIEICSGMGVYGASLAEDEKSYGALYQGLRAVNATSHGSILQKDLAAVLCRNRVFTYPNTFEETFCISVLEAQAAGLPVVTSHRGALPERVTDGIDGFLIPGNPGEAEYDTAFIKATQELLTNDTLWQQFSAASQAKAQKFTYEILAGQWQDFFTSELKNKSPELPRDLGVFKMQILEIPHPTKSGIKIPFNRNDLSGILHQALQPYGFQIKG